MILSRDSRLPAADLVTAAPLVQGASSRKALACVMGGMDLVRPLGLAGIRCAVVTRAGAASCYSRFTETALCWDDFSEDAEQLVDALFRFGVGRPEPPVLFYEEDSQLLLVSRHRERLARAFRFVVADPTLVEDLVDKARFQVLAERLHLPVPAMRRIHPVMGSRPADLDLRFPVVIKPLTRRRPWDAIGFGGKALQVDSPAALRDLWPRLVAVGMDLVAQELIRGPETCIESYHVYVDRCGTIVGEFTGRKVRTYPPTYGHSTALVVSNATDVTELGRALVAQLKLRGVAKFDFKRGPDGRLHLLEVNPRFNLWHHLGAIAGVNLPALVYADLTGLPRLAPARARAGVRWCRIWEDLPAARACGMPLMSWLSWVLRCEAKSAMAWDDPVPLVRGAMSRFFSRRSVATLPPRSAQPGPRVQP
jgi:D-aspartate ligase